MSSDKDLFWYPEEDLFLAVSHPISEISSRKSAISLHKKKDPAW